MKSSFFDIIGHDRVCDVLERSFEHDRVSHAYLFVGPEGVGRTTVAYALLNRFLGNDGNDLETHADATIVRRLMNEKTEKRKTVITVQQIRDLRERLSKSAFQGGGKVAFIEEAHKMHNAAANALLKTLEEPEGKTCIVLRAPHVDAVPATIASRCQLLRFHSVSREEIASALTDRDVERERAKRFAALSLGRPGFALRLLENEGVGEEAENHIDAFITALEGTIADRLRFVKDNTPEKGGDRRRETEALFDVWERIVRDCLLYNAQCSDLIVNQQWGDRLRALARQKSPKHWSNALRVIGESRRATSKNANIQLALEHAILHV